MSDAEDLAKQFVQYCDRAFPPWASIQNYPPSSDFLRERKLALACSPLRSVICGMLELAVRGALTKIYGFETHKVRISMDHSAGVVLIEFDDDNTTATAYFLER